MLRIEKFSDDEVYSLELAAILKSLYSSIFSPPDNMSLDEKIKTFHPEKSASKKIIIYYDGEKPVGYLCMQRYLFDIDNKKTNVFRSQAGFIEKYRNNNLMKSSYIKMVTAEIVKNRYPSYFFAVCIHPSSYRASVKNSLMNHTWPTRRNYTSNNKMKANCRNISDLFDLKVIESDGVFVSPTNFGTAHGSQAAKDNTNRDADFFLKKNKGYEQGEGLVVISKISFSDIAYRLLGHSLSKMKRKLYRRRAKIRQFDTVEKAE
ncbi:hypothetical protein [Rouxiella sp. Mn2063]|uniref:hypothetical protein n=1 Tax=Rouxiella sp. Mn2063 TaxID=3395262 RepID=UPI003BD4BBDC